MENDLICPNCNNRNHKNSNFCSYCGSYIPKKVLAKECPKCKMYFDTSATFCGICGETLLFTEIYDNSTADSSDGQSNEAMIFCQHCGAENFKEFNFCSCCGKPLSITRKRYCSRCNAETQYNQVFCGVCGNSLLTVEKSIPVKHEKIEITEKFKLLNHSILLLLAAILFAFSFIPIFTLDIKILDKFSVKARFNAYQTVGLVFDNLMTYNEEELEDSFLYKKYSKYKEKFEDNVGMLNLDSLSSFPLIFKKNTDKLIRSTIKLNLRNQDTPFSLPIVVASIFAFVFILTSFFALLFAFLSLLSNYITVFNYSDECIKCMILAPFMAAISYITLSFSPHTNALQLLDISIINVNFSSPGLWFAIIPAFLIVFILFIQNAIHKKKAFSFKRAALNFWILLFSIATLFFSTSSLLLATIKGEFKNLNIETSVTVPLEANFYKSLNTGDEMLDSIAEGLDVELEDYSKYVKFFLNLYGKFTILQTESGEANLITQAIIVYSISSIGEGNLTRFNSVINLMIIAIVFIALAGAAALVGIAFNKPNWPIILAYSLISASFAVAAFILNQNCIKIIEEALTLLEIDSVFSVNLGVGVPYFAICAVLTLLNACSLILVKKTKTHRQLSLN